jgi:hypothetical protein
MRLQQYITENKDMSFEEIITLIMNKCQPYIKEILPIYHNDNLMYSGRKHLSSNTIIKKIRNDRKPTDTPIKIQELFDSLFKKYHGWKPRSSSIFCTGSISTAGDYGKVYMVFPMGKFKYLWNPDISDLFSDVVNDPDNYDIRVDDPDILYDFYGADIEDYIRDMGDDLYYNEYGGDPDDPDFEQWMDDHYDDIRDSIVHRMAKENEENNAEIYDGIISNYKSTDLKKAIKTGNEIMVNCNEYFLVIEGLYYDLITYYLQTYGNKKPIREILQDMDESFYYDNRYVKFWKD